MDPITIVAKLTDFLLGYAGESALNNLLRNQQKRSAFEVALRRTLTWYQGHAGETKKALADALLLTKGPLFNNVARAELVLLLDVNQRPDFEKIASVWQRSLDERIENVDFKHETNLLLNTLKNYLWNTDEFRPHMDSRAIYWLEQNNERQNNQIPPYQPEITSSLDGLSPPFYHPLQLGRLVRQSISPRLPQEEKSNPLEFPIGWQESSEHVSQQRFERENADLVWQRHQQKSAGIYVILGEPGSGKTTLIKHWHQGRDDVAVFRLRELGRVPCTEEGRQTTRLWLLDGWDELPVAQRSAEQVAALPGLKIVTCRTASYYGEFDKHTANDQIHYVMGMLPRDQRVFLLALVGVWQGSRHSGMMRQRLNQVDGAWADKLWQTLQSDDKVRELAANPLLLTLIALMSPPGKEIKLPKNRAQFYQEAFYQLCENRHPAVIDSLVFSVVQAWLVHLVASESVQRDTKIPRQELDHAYRKLKNNGLDDGFSKDTLRNVAVTAGILKDYGHHYEFLHLTFHEWCLAQANIQQSNLVGVVKRHWQQPDYQEVLALTWSLSTAGQRKAATEWLIDQGYHVRIINRKERTFSGLRTALHVWRRSGVAMAAEGNGVDAYLWSHCQTSGLRKIAIAADSQTPDEVLAMLTHDADTHVRQQVAGNTNTPAEVLTWLAADDDQDVRWRAAENANTPVEVLTRLAADDDQRVRMCVASNANTPGEVLTRLAADEDQDVRESVAGNANTPVEVLTRLAADEDWSVHWHVAGNANTPSEVLTRLAVDDDLVARQWVAGNANTPAEVLTRLAADEDWGVRLHVAENANTPAEVLTRLVADDDQRVRMFVAGNAITPAEVLTRLAADEGWGVRWHVAGNANTPAEVLTHLAVDDDKKVNELVAKNPNTPLECL